MDDKDLELFDERYVLRVEHLKDINELKELHIIDMSEMKQTLLSLRKDVGVLKWTGVTVAGTVIATLVTALLKFVVG